MSRRRVAGPRLGATPANAHAARLSYISPRVPSIGSMMTRMAAASSRAPSGNTFTPSMPVSDSIPSAISTSGAVRAHSRQNSSSTGSTSVSIW